MIRWFTSTVTNQSRGRRSSASSGFSSDSTSPACSMPRNAIVTRVGLELEIASPPAVIMETGYGPTVTSSSRPTSPIAASSRRLPFPARRPSSQA
jgi:hypothetical protein